MPISARALLPGSAFRQALAACDVVLDVGEGDSFSDIYGLKRLFYLVATKLLAARHAVLILSPQTLGPFASSLAERLARWALGKATMVFARDPLSYDWLVARGPSPRFAQAIDMAFKLPFSPRAPVSSPGPARLGINVSGLLFGGGYGGGNSLGLRTDYAALTRQLITWARQQQAEVWLVPHVTSNSLSEEDDLAAAQRLVAEFDGVHLAGPFASPVDAKSFMASLDFFVGGRMHACIGAFSAGVPTVPLAYSRKFNGLFGALGYRWFVDCRALSTDEAFAFVCQAFQRRSELATAVQAANALALQKLQPYQSCLVGALQAGRSRP
ncbi:MAG: polysaccharide pyruvyl transferase family protein [Pseudomonadota bacterium]